MGKEILRNDPKERLRRRLFASSVTSLKVEVNANLNGILRCLKKGKKKEDFIWNTNRQLPPTQEHTRLVGDCLSVHISIFNFKF